MNQNTEANTDAEIEERFAEIYILRNGSGKWDAEDVQNKIDAVEALIDKIPDEAKRTSFQRRVLYHRGLVQREVAEPDHFLHAADTHEEAALIAPTEPERRFEQCVAAIERMHHAVETDNAALLQGQLEALAEHESALRTAVAQTPHAEGEKCLRADIPAHRLYCCALMDVEDPERINDLDALGNLPERLLESYQVWTKICNSLLADTPAVIATAEELLAKETHPTHVCFGRYIAAQSFLQQGWPHVARVLLQNIVDYPSHSAHFVRATARRLIEKIDA